ncbi:TerB family tellurite resistance protein [Aquibium sp. ELW1220]|uniref:tellurite resistance TerB family protein n=1 Tax=Aquibium sp. ELW1220 TaxID=2976766 RepID=UPI0025B18F97|nr:TerB family tellurite resistance protein [Aquibium sp. ELW1220]MDN2582621.1 TerB family tellurite resistance protein [Aquibium sp. ELW1220]
MFDRFISFLKELPGAGPGSAQDDRDDPRLAAAALMVHVMEADGVEEDAERATLREALTRAYGLTGRELDAFVARAEEEVHQSVDLYAFTSVLKRHLDEQARIEFIGIMWEIVFADGEVSELEDNIVWRVAELIGVDRRDRVLMRQKADPNRTDEPGL